MKSRIQRRIAAICVVSYALLISGISVAPKAAENGMAWAEDSRGSLRINDRDGDGLVDAFEGSYGLSSKRSDSDGNGVLDRNEVRESRTLRDLHLEYLSGLLEQQAPSAVQVAGTTRCPARRIGLPRSEGDVSASATRLERLLTKRSRKCQPPTRKPPARATPRPTSPPSKTPAAPPTRAPTPAPPSSGGNAAVGKAFYSQVCLACHGVRAGRSEQQILSAMNSVSDHASVRKLVTSQVVRDVAAYLATVR